MRPIIISFLLFANLITYAQITFEEITAPVEPNIQIQKVGEANQNQFVLTAKGLYHKLVHESQWIQSDTLLKGDLEIQYAPNGDMYINLDTIILHSSDNSTSFDTIITPLNGFQGFHFFMQVLDNGIIFIYSDIGDLYYTLNNGKDWIEVQTNFGVPQPKAKLIGNTIYLVSYEVNSAITRINILNNETTVEE